MYIYIFISAVQEGLNLSTSAALSEPSSLPDYRTISVSRDRSLGLVPVSFWQRREDLSEQKLVMTAKTLQQTLTILSRGRDEMVFSAVLFFSFHRLSRCSNVTRISRHVLRDKML